MREAKQQITAHLLKRLRGQPKQKTKQKTVLGKILKMAARFKGKHRCGGGGEGGRGVRANSKVKGERSHGTKRWKERAKEVHCIHQRKHSDTSSCYVLHIS